MNRTLHTTPSSALFLGQGWENKRNRGIYLTAHREIAAYHAEEILSAFSDIEDKIAQGKTAFGFIAYEAATAFDLPTHRNSGEFPLVWFGFCHEEEIQSLSLTEVLDPPPFPEASLNIQSPLSLPYEPYEKHLSTIKRYIARGDTYQVNFTIRADCAFPIQGIPLFQSLYREQPVPYAVFLQTRNWEIHSLSPELFLKKSSDHIESRPMKGTLHRGRTTAEDRLLEDALRQSEKDRAENVMILDMVRNDFGRCCLPGSVHAEKICQIERYRSLYQMTSTVHGQVIPGSTFSQILAATFPAASITGAPKYRTMEIIRDLETKPRHCYCGSIGLIKPNGDFIFNVAIRTLVGKEGQYTLGAGGGIVWDSDPHQEYQEVKNKIAFTQIKTPSFTLLETIRLDSMENYRFLEEHLDRLADSASYWDFEFDRSQARQRLLNESRKITEFPRTIRLSLAHNGTMEITHRPVTQPPEDVRIRVSSITVHSQNRFLYHKTTHRTLYDQERERGNQLGFFETLFLNEKAHITEGCISNLFYRIEGEWYTPPLYDGLLPGIWRNRFMKEHAARERSVSIAEIVHADEIRIGNSVMGSITVNEIHNAPQII